MSNLLSSTKNKNNKMQNWTLVLLTATSFIIAIVICERKLFKFFWGASSSQMHSVVCVLQQVSFIRRRHIYGTYFLFLTYSKFSSTSFDFWLHINGRQLQLFYWELVFFGLIKSGNWAAESCKLEKRIGQQVFFFWSPFCLSSCWWSALGDFIGYASQMCFTAAE